MKRALSFGALAALGWLVGAASTVGGRQEQAAVEVGAGPLRERALAFVGRHEYQVDAVTLYGYFSTVTGLEPALTFTDPDARSEATARFTYAGDASLSTPLGDDGVTTVAGTGTLTI